MISKLLTVLALLACTLASSQSLYRIQYNFHQAGDSTTYNAFLIKYDDGTGLLRVRYALPVTNEDILVETDLEDVYGSDPMDSATLLVKSSNPRFIMGNDKVKVNLPLFLFKENTASGYFEPTGISTASEKPVMPPGTSFASELIERSSLNQDFVLQFFSEDEDFYTNLFKNKTRGLTPAEKSIKLYLLIVADTLDEEIGSSCAKDMKRMVETFTTLTSFLGIKMLPTTISGKEYSKKSVQDAVSSLKPSGNDIVVFYYSGHGFRTPENLRRFPNMKLKNFRNLRQNFRDSATWINKDRNDNITFSMNMEDIFNSIKGKGARFNLVLSDCCNSDIFASNAKGTKPGKTKGSGVEWSEDNIRLLFLNPNPMSVLATAASTGQKASSNDDFGGFFSFYFKAAMENYSSKLRNNVTWDLILQDTKAQTIRKANHTYCDKPYIPANICQQYPDYKIVFGK